MVDNSDDLEIGSVENFGGSKDEQFSHSSLVMSAMKKCLEAGTKEMKEGWFNERHDRQGNIIRTYIEDTRKAFIESVRSLKMVMAGDLDTRAVQKIRKYLLTIKRKERDFIEYNNQTWDNLSLYERGLYVKQGQRHFSKILTHPLLKQQFIEFELIQWRNIFSELARLTKRLDYFKSEAFEV